MSFIHQCPVCSSRELHPVLFRKSIPVHQNSLSASKESAKKISRGDLDLAVCPQCGFLCNRAFDLSKLNYDQSYENSQDHSKVFKEHLAQLAHDILIQNHVQNCRIVEVGCGKGFFLKSLVENSYNNTGYGFDPSYIGEEKLHGDRLNFIKTYYDPAALKEPVDIVICRHVIEHISNPLEFLQFIREKTHFSKNAKIFFETPALDWIIQNQVIWDFFYEHCSYFTKDSLREVFERAGFAVDNVKTIFDGQYLWLEASVASAPHRNHDIDPSWLTQLVKSFESLEGTSTHWKKVIENQSSKEKVALWGAGAKGTTLANLADPECKFLDCVIDVNPNKQGHYIAGTGHPIVDCRTAAARSVKSVFLMNPNYKAECEEIIVREQLNLKILNP